MWQSRSRCTLSGVTAAQLMESLPVMVSFRAVNKNGCLEEEDEPLLSYDLAVKRRLRAA